MIVRTSRELGSAIRRARLDRSWSQAELAARAGTTRAWVIGIEQGKATAELGLVLRAIAALGLTLDLVADPAVDRASGTAEQPAAARAAVGRATVDLGGIIAAARGEVQPAADARGGGADG
jgi:y4mF family transcriptional regulator